MSGAVSNCVFSTGRLFHFFRLRFQEFFGFSKESPNFDSLEPVIPAVWEISDVQSIRLFDQKDRSIKTPPGLVVMIEMCVAHRPEEPIPGFGRNERVQLVKPAEGRFVLAGAVQGRTMHADVAAKPGNTDHRESDQFLSLAASVFLSDAGIYDSTRNAAIFCIPEAIRNLNTGPAISFEVTRAGLSD